MKQLESKPEETEASAALGLGKREMASVFRERLMWLIARRNEPASRFAARCGIDRSAMSQFLDTGSDRLPRSETLASIAQAEGVSIDWLLGLSQNEDALGELDTVTGVETASDDIENSKLAEWRREAIGYKIRYVPSSLPDMLRTPATTKYEFGSSQVELIDTKTEQSRSQLDYSRLPESDLEITMPAARLEAFAKGEGVWSGLARGARIAQLQYMADLMEEIYPTLRLYLYDEQKFFSVPFTVFGPKRAAVYLGHMYLVMNSVALIREMTKRFDQLVRHATITADRSPEFIRNLKVK